MKLNKYRQTLSKRREMVDGETIENAAWNNCRASTLKAMHALRLVKHACYGFIRLGAFRAARHRPKMPRPLGDESWCWAFALMLAHDALKTNFARRWRPTGLAPRLFFLRRAFEIVITGFLSPHGRVYASASWPFLYRRGTYTELRRPSKVVDGIIIEARGPSQRCASLHCSYFNHAISMCREAMKGLTAMALAYRLRTFMGSPAIISALTGDTLFSAKWCLSSQWWNKAAIDIRLCCFWRLSRFSTAFSAGKSSLEKIAYFLNIFYFAGNIDTLLCSCLFSFHSRFSLLLDNVKQLNCIILSS